MTTGVPLPTFPCIIGRRTLIVVLALAATALFPAAGVASPHSGSTAPKHKFGRGSSTNWSGYAISGSGATHVVGTWTQPAAVCSPGENSWSSPWVGIDGNNSNTVEQIGTDTDCSNGQPFYYAWYEMYPKPLVFINTIPVSPGNTFTGEVTYASGSFTLKLTNLSTGNSFTTVQSSKKARRTSVEWVMEGPSSGLLTHFSTGGKNTIPFSAAEQSISGKTGNISTFTGGGSTNPESITMVSPKGGTTRAQPTPINWGGTGFNVNWLRG
jgi:hypothetical protein